MRDASVQERNRIFLANRVVGSILCRGAYEIARGIASPRILLLSRRAFAILSRRVESPPVFTYIVRQRETAAPTSQPSIQPPVLFREQSRNAKYSDERVMRSSRALRLCEDRWMGGSSPLTLAIFLRASGGSLVPREASPGPSLQLA